MTTPRFATWLAGRRVRRVAALTGAGISAESGIPTFRGADGLWGDADPAELFTLDALLTRPREAWALYDALRVRVAAAAPNAGHVALAALQRHTAFTLITQNIDGLHQCAGSTEVLELHGSLWRLRCDACRHAEDNAVAPLPALPPACPGCGGVLRPDIVLFTEPLPRDTLARAVPAVEQCDLLLVVGTSGVVYPAAALPHTARAHGAAVVEINPSPTPVSEIADYIIRAPAAEALPEVAAALEHREGESGSGIVL